MIVFCRIIFRPAPAVGILMAGRRPVAERSGAMEAKAGTMKSPTCRMAGTAPKFKKQEDELKLWQEVLLENNLL